MKIELNQKFYRYVTCAGVFEYVVKQINHYETVTDQGAKQLTTYVLECQACNHGYKCLLRCELDDYGNLIYIKLDDDDEYNEDYHDDQRYWHHGDGKFYPDRKLALIEVYEKNIKTLKEDEEKLESKLKDTKSKLEEIKNLVKELKGN